MAGWIWIAGLCVLVLVVGLSFVLGAAVGASSSYEQFEGLILPLLSTAGSWIAGIGALGAVVVSLWLSDKQRREDREGVKINNSVEWNRGYWNFTLSVVSTGRRPVTVTHCEFRSKKELHSFMFLGMYIKGANLPITLGYGEIAEWTITTEMIPQLARYAEPEDLYIKIFSTMDEYSRDISTSMKAVLKNPEKYANS